MATAASITARELEEPAYSSSQGVDWAQYFGHRPSYPETFFNLIYNYHQLKEGTEFTTAHDVGAGCGIVAMTLASHFEKVIVSDPNDGYTALARSCLVEGARLPEDAFFFLQERAEASLVMDDTVDLITACQMMHFTNADAAVSEFERQLKPGGTLAMSLYAVPRILDDEPAQAAWAELWREFARRATGDVADRAITLCNSAYESIELSEDGWADVKRLYINAHGRYDQWMLSGDNRIGESRIKSREVELYVDNDPDWTGVHDIQWLKAHLETLVPRIPESEMQGLWDNLERILDGKDVEIEFPVVLILATKA